MIDQKNPNVKTSNSSNDTKKGTKTIYIGDSRTVGMCASLGNGNNYSNCSFNGTPYVNGDDIFIAKSSMAYAWFEGTAVPAVNKILENNPNTTYNIVSYMGVNWLLGDVDKYVKKYPELAKGAWKKHNVILVSVNPVDEEKEKKNGYSTKQANIITFNSKIKACTNNISNLSYCDVYNKIIDDFDTSDGLHYTANTYKDIYKYTNKCID